jgi:hypothetical protein
MTSFRLDELVNQLEAELGLEPGFLESLDGEAESDWAFVIKLHALVEAAVTHVLTTALRRPELERVFARIDMSNKQSGKAAYIDALELMSKPERRFVSSLSELRNDLVHDVRNTRFQLHEHVESMDAEGKQRFARNFNLFGAGAEAPMAQLLVQDPRQGLWHCGMALLGSIYLRSTLIKAAH